MKVSHDVRLGSGILAFAVYTCLYFLIVQSEKCLVVAGVTRDEEEPPTWYDCSDEIGISDTKLLTFTEVRSDPPIVTPTTRQKILKTIRYFSLPESFEPVVLRKINVGFHQYYKVFGKKWMTFLKLNGIDACDEHKNLCPLRSGESKEIVTLHPPLNRLTPYGWYRSRQVYSDAVTGARIGCVDMAFQYCESVDDCKYHDNIVSEEDIMNSASVRL